ncbi:MAG: DegQ family serine endoprotease [Gammaproteobacteria bacterium]|nr:DegQ family serine endoprotease [Gammaproteobacteria bacterium]
MKSAIARILHRHQAYAAALAVPLALGVVTWPGVEAAPVMPGATPTFTQPQFADVIETVQPAVVKIAVVKNAAKVARLEGRPMELDPDSPMGQFFRHFGPGPFAFGPQQADPQAKIEGLGSGFIVDKSGYIVTNNHVIDGADDIKVTLTDGRELPAKLVGTDPMTDLAVIKVEPKGELPAVAFGDSDRARVGDWVVAIGSPFGLGGSVTAGIISARGRDIHSGPYDDYLQIDAPINSGNSGGPVINAEGRVVGVNTAIYSPNGGNIGIGFAIPAREAERVVGELRNHGAVTRGWLGVQIQPVSAAMAEALNIKDASGALVAAVVEKSPAARAGVKVGDVILKFGDTAIKDARDLSKAVAKAEPGAKVHIDIVRNGKSERLATVIDRNAQNDVAFKQDAAPTDNGADNLDEKLGVALGALSSDARAQLNLDDSVKGALVVGVKNGSAAEESGLKPGDVIVRVNNAEVADAQSAKHALGSAHDDKRPVVVLIRRGDQQFFTAMKIA